MASEGFYAVPSGCVGAVNLVLIIRVKDTGGIRCNTLMKIFDKYNQQKLGLRFSHERTPVNSRKDPGQFTKGPGSIHERTPVNSRHIPGVIRMHLLTKLKSKSYDFLQEIQIQCGNENKPKLQVDSPHQISRKTDYSECILMFFINHELHELHEWATP